MSNKVLIRRIMEQKEDAQNTTYTREEAINLLDNRGFKTLEDLEEYFRFKPWTPKRKYGEGVMPELKPDPNTVPAAMVKVEQPNLTSETIMENTDFTNNDYVAWNQKQQWKELDTEEDQKMFKNPVDNEGDLISGAYIKKKYKDLPEVVNLLLAGKRLPITLYKQLFSVSDKEEFISSVELKKEADSLGISVEKLIVLITEKDV